MHCPELRSDSQKIQTTVDSAVDCTNADIGNILSLHLCSPLLGNLVQPAASLNEPFKITSLATGQPVRDLPSRLQ